MDNHTEISGFIIEGFVYPRMLRVPIFSLLLLVYLVLVIENLLMLSLILIDSHLHNPMYFFLSNLSILDICLTASIVPKMLLTFLDRKHISFSGCMTQLFFFIAFQSGEFLILTAMSYDRYIAICNPLLYRVVMNPKICSLLAIVSWTIGFLMAVGVTDIISQTTFCRSTVINHFFCDITPLLALSCRNTNMVEIVILVQCTIVGFPSFSLILSSYVYIISAISKINSTEGRLKAFSTCSSHLTAVILIYGILFCVYLRPTAAYTMEEGKRISLLNVVAIPLLNPIIYSLRNKDIKNAFYRAIKK